MKRKIRFISIYCLVATIFIFLALEGAVRLLKLAPHQPKALGGYDSDSQFNSFGFRDTEHDYAKPQGVFRILGLGDSFTEGAGANFEETYLFRLESMLNNRQGKHPKIEIIKAGIGGYSAEPERILLQYYGVKYEPDLILVGFRVKFQHSLLRRLFHFNLAKIDV